MQVRSGRAITHQVYIEPHALVIGLPDEHLALCHEVMGDAGLRVDVMRTGLGLALAAACEKIPKALPQMVVASASLGPDALSALEDRAIAVGAVFLLLGERPDYESMGRQLETGVSLARERFGRRSSVPPS
jgi:hypothetical protein